jgi:hypothetical protein
MHPKADMTGKSTGHLPARGTSRSPFVEGIVFVVDQPSKAQQDSGKIGTLGISHWNNRRFAAPA